MGGDDHMETEPSAAEEVELTHGRVLGTSVASVHLHSRGSAGPGMVPKSKDTSTVAARKVAGNCGRS